MVGKVYGREPAMWLAAVGAVWQILSAFGLDFDPKLQSIVTAVIAALLGVVVAIQVHDGLISALSGLITAGTSLVSYFAFHWDAEHQAKFVGAVMLLIAWFLVRPNVVAPVGGDVSPAGRLVART